MPMKREHDKLDGNSHYNLVITMEGEPFLSGGNVCNFLLGVLAKMTSRTTWYGHNDDSAPAMPKLKGAPPCPPEPSPCPPEPPPCPS
ncbi:hypothetical protein DPMN_101141 [Dreissena polymorpha]|uniref:Uncharacterized protein n=1 Tax=Dreissena polymorpha TaxID=45954 RepID=A0A9D4LH23_DREPO|nr:hypothetical protein DPMN_101141 [Dreissena polymorpha]